jgi:hypothetical protein
LNPTENQIPTEKVKESLETVLSTDTKNGASFVLLNSSKQVVGILSTWDEISDYNLAYLWCLYDININMSLFDAENIDDLMRAYIIEVNQSILEYLRHFEVDQFTWYMAENDGGHMEGSITVEGQKETGLVKDILIKCDFKMPIIDDAMIREF